MTLLQMRSNLKEMFEIQRQLTNEMNDICHNMTILPTDEQVQYSIIFNERKEVHEFIARIESIMDSFQKYKVANLS